MADVVGDNVRALRLLRRLTQDDLAARMRHLGHPSWSRATVSEVERGGRNVVIDEALALALALSASLRDVLSPRGVTGRETAPVDFAEGHRPMPADFADRWITGQLAPMLRWENNEADRLVYDVDERLDRPAPAPATAQAAAESLATALIAAGSMTDEDRRALAAQMHKALDELEETTR